MRLGVVKLNGSYFMLYFGINTPMQNNTMMNGIGMTSPSPW